MGNEKSNKTAKLTHNLIYAYFERINGIKCKQTDDVLENSFLSARFGI